MPAAFKDLCLDAHDAPAVARFWAAALGQDAVEDGGADAVVRGPNLFPLWVNHVPEPKVVKNRVHLDVRAADVGALVALGATVLAEHDGWTVLADPEGNELCAFPADDGAAPAAPAEVFALCVDSAEPVELATWWHARLGGTLGPGPDGRPRWLHGARGAESIILKFVQVDDERSVKNRCHWDVTADVDELVDAGAQILAELPSWTVFADPQGNEVCAFGPDAV